MKIINKNIIKIYYLLFIILFIIIIFGILYKNNLIEYFSPCEYNHIILNNVQLYELKELYIELINFFKENDIEYFAIAGTLIGTIRNGGLLPFDDDIDIGIFDKDILKINEYSNDNYYFENIGFGYKFFKKNNNTKLKIFIDIMVFELKDDMYKIINNYWDNESIKIDEIYPLIETKYSNLDIKVPNKYNLYLDRAFPDWDTKIKFQCGHFSDENNCTHKKMNLPNEIDVDHDNNKYLCYTNFN